jgi:hypothetical protein
MQAMRAREQQADPGLRLARNGPAQQVQKHVPHLKVRVLTLMSAKSDYG